MKDFFRTWVDWWLLIPVSLALAIGSYWFVPWLIGEYGLLHILTGRFIPEQDMAYTGTAWLYDMFKSSLVFCFGLGVVFLVYKLFFPSAHNYLEYGNWNFDFRSSNKVIISIAIPAFLLLCFCLVCIAVFK